MKSRADVVIIGAGVLGATLARELAKYHTSVVVVEKNRDVGGYSSKSNGATITAAQDAEVGSIQPGLKIASLHMYQNHICEELDLEIRRVGALTVALNEEELCGLRQLEQQGIANHYYNAQPMSPEKAHELVPSLTNEMTGALWSPDDCIIDVFELVFANMENAIENGVQLLLDTEVTNIVRQDGAVQLIRTSRGDIETRFVVNCAGAFADRIANMVGVDDYHNVAKAGEIFILDKELPYAPKCLVNPMPTHITRGILIVPTLHGNLLLGPTVEYRNDVCDASTSRAKLDEIIEKTRRYIPAINAKDSVTQFTGVRPTIDKGGWTMRAVREVKGYLEAVGITGGVGAAPAIAVHMRELLSEEGLKLRRKDDFNPIRVGIKRFNQMSDRERDAHIKQNPAYGNVICRCETVTEAEIVEAIHRMPPAQTLDAVKRRLRAGMGRCQGGFCSTRVVEILARELKTPVETVCKNEQGSELVYRTNR